MDKKKILILTRRNTQFGGAEHVALKLGNALSKKGYEIYFLFSFLDLRHNHYSKDHYYFFKGYRYYLNLINSFDCKNNLLKKLKFKIRIIYYFFQLKKFVNDNKINLIISFSDYHNILAILTKKFFNLKYKTIISIQINPFSIYLRFNNFKYCIFKIIKYNRFLYNKADFIVPVSQYIEKRFLKKGINCNKIKTIYNFLDLEKCLKLTKNKIPDKYKFIFDKNKIIFISIGRLDPQKGHFNLIKSFKLVMKKYSNVKLIILGEGSLKKYLTFSIKKMKLTNKIILLGNQKNIFPFLKNSDFFIFPSLYEGLPNALIEALSTNIPIISADCQSGPREVLCPELGIFEEIEYPYYGKYGILFKPFKITQFKSQNEFSEEEKSLARLIINLIENSGKIKKNFSNGLERAKYFDSNKIIPQWEKLIQYLFKEQQF